MRNISLLLILLAGLFISCSDDDDSVLNPYSFGISSFNSDSSSDLVKIKDYFDSKGCTMDPKVFSGEDNAEADRKAKELFDSSVAKVSLSELDQMGLSLETSFSYTVSRLKNPSYPDSEVLIIGSFNYPN